MTLAEVCSRPVFYCCGPGGPGGAPCVVGWAGRCCGWMGGLVVFFMDDRML